ncbi:heparinase II/III family protein [Gautieria morchelliformis]|nr:heparinase II/III family protein [Gautieria morchelliformis]
MAGRSSYDSAHLPLSNAQYQSTPNPNTPYRSGDPYYNESGYLPPPAKKRGLSPWIKFGVPVLLLVIVGAVVGGVLGSRNHNKNASTSSSSSGNSNPADASSAVSAKNALGVFPVSTDSYELPVYPSTTNTAAFTIPTFQGNSVKTWPSDPFAPSSPSMTTPRSDRPRLIAPAYKWQALPDLIRSDPYLSEWNATIFGNATTWKAMGTVPYVADGGLTGSGILDVSRQVKERIKAWSYAYRLTNDSSWAERAWEELFTASGNSTTPFGNTGDNWNTQHFLDVGEMTAAFAIGYDWLYDYWTQDRRTALMWTILELGISKGIQAYNGASFGWWNNNVNGNWNCVSNGGLVLGSLALLGDDPTGQAAQMINLAVPNAVQNCAMGPSTDGTWSETANYWYFGTTGHAEMTSALMTATGSDYGLLNTNNNFNKTGLYHMYVTGMTSLFNYGDHGPNKYSTTANSMIFYGGAYSTPSYMLFQRDHQDAAEPTGMFWYDPSVTGAFWDGMPIDHYFADSEDNWGSMRTSWTDNTGVYVAMKAGKSIGHQTHGDLDQGDFVLDAMGQRWAGELGSGDYLSTGYFSSETQDSQRWLYYRKRTEGQNCVLVGGQNQNAAAAPTGQFGTTGEAQGSSTVYSVPGSSTAFFTADLVSAYNQTTSYKRGIRMINGRKQVLLQDDINVQADIQWRMHTNATVAIDSAGTTATLTLGGQTMQVQLINAPAGAKFTTQDAVRLSTDPALPSNQSDQPNPGVTVLTIALGQGTYSLQVLFNPQWSGMSASSFVTPPVVPLDNWSLTSHN